MAKNYYKTLGVSSNASKSQIKRAYRKLAMKYHPDKNNSPEAQIIFIEINEAYSFLTDENNQKLKKPIVKNTSRRKSKTSQEELNKRMEWARRYVEYKKIKEEKINEITYYKIQKSSLRWIIPTINSLSIFFAFLILLDFKILPTSSINVTLITRYVDMDSEKLALKFKDDDSNKFQFGISFEDIKHIIKDRKGIFVSKRNIDSFTEITKYIMQNYYEIQKDIEKNKFPLEKDMFKQISNVING